MGGSVQVAGEWRTCDQRLAFGAERRPLDRWRQSTYEFLLVHTVTSVAWKYVLRWRSDYYVGQKRVG
jgi:hypothetical protein